MSKKSPVEGKDARWSVIRRTPEYVLTYSREWQTARIIDAKGYCVIDIARTRTDLEDFLFAIWEILREKPAGATHEQQ